MRTSHSGSRTLRAMRTPRVRLRGLLMLALGILVGGCRASDVSSGHPDMQLPAPKTAGSVSVEAALAARKVVRGFAVEVPSAADLSQLLWAAQGIVDPVSGARTTFTPGGVHALDLWVARTDGVHRYAPATHSLTRVLPMDVRRQLAQATSDADELKAAPILIVITGQPGKARPRWGDRAERMVAIEGGHAGQSLLLQAAPLGLAATPLSIVDDEAIRTALVLPKDQLPIHVIAVGLPAR